jgi:bleomycin hydrolase
MLMNCHSLATAIVVATSMMSDPNDLIANPEGGLSEELLMQLRDNYRMDDIDRARFNAVSNSDINKLALNRDIVRGEDGHFSHRISTKGITNQKASGRCWMFAGFNVMRPKVIHEMGLEDFEFSSSYLQFWDKMEKSNLYLESVIELRDVDPLDREWQLVNEWMVGDGGWWNFVTSLIDKYGVVPASVMPETHSSENTRVMNTVLGRLLRSRAAGIIEAANQGGSVNALRSAKKKALADIYRFLCINLGEPPAEFEWRYEVKKKGNDNEKKQDAEDDTKVVQERLSALRRYTPKGFYKEFVGVDLSQFVCLYNDASKPTGKHYCFSRARNIAGDQDMHFANIEIGEMKKIAVNSVLANQPMWFAVNMGVDQSGEHGLMEHELFDYEALFGIDMPLSKAERTRFNAGASNHAMVLTGVDLHKGLPRKWLVENSWGVDKGNKGRWTLYDKWFDEHVYTVIVHRQHVPKEILSIFEEEAEILPAWYPGAMGIQRNP